MTANHSLRTSFHLLPTSTCLSLLSSCKESKAVLQIHARAIVSGLKDDTLTLTHLIKAYSFLHKNQASRCVFDSTPNPDVALYNTMIRVYVKSRSFGEALRMYGQMKERGKRPDKFTFNFVVKACTGALDFREGVLVHREIASRNLESDVFIGTSLVDMYCKMGELRNARQAFDKLPHRDIVACNAMISGLAQGPNPSEAMGFFRRIQLWGLGINSVSLLNLIPAVSRLKDFDSCRKMHCFVIRHDFGTEVFNGLIDMYSKCGDFSAALIVFDSMKCRDEISWSTIMAGCAFNDRFIEVLELFDCLTLENLKRNEVAFISALLAASELRDLDKGIEIHNFAREDEIDSNVRVATSIMTMYAKCGKIDEAIDLFDKLQGKDLIAHSSLLSALVQSGYSQEALSLFRHTQTDKFILLPDGATLSSVLSACADLSQIRLGKSVHCYAIKANIYGDVSTGTALVSMYAKCRFFTQALIVFDRISSKDVITWNALLNAYAKIGEPHRIMDIFRKSLFSGIKPDSITMLGLVQVCIFQKNPNRGLCVHGFVIKNGFESENCVKSCLIGLYSKFGDISSVEFLFNGIDFTKSQVSWNVLISGYSQGGHFKEAMYAFSLMKNDNFEPNAVTFASLLPSVARLSALREGSALHSQIEKMGFLSNKLLCNGLVDMYAKCGQIDSSEKFFEEMEFKDTVSFNAMISGYSIHGLGNRAVSLFHRMTQSDIKPDNLTFVSVLSACRHAGLVTEGREIFRSMREKQALEPNLEHYACVVDLLGRSGLFEEAMSLISEMPMEPDSGVWGALLGCCKMYCNAELGKVALDHIVKLEPKNPVNYLVLSDIYAESGRLSEANEIRSMMKDLGVKKSPGCSWFEVETHRHNGLT